jgi:alpha-glucoside transport system permease protein
MIVVALFWLIPNNSMLIISSGPKWAPSVRFLNGAGEWTLFRRVVLPIGVAAAASLAIFQFTWTWNDLLVALVILGADPHVPITLFIYGQERALAANLWVISTGPTVSIIIPLLVPLRFQRYFVSGMLGGAVK